MVNPAGHRRSETRGDLWRELRRLRYSSGGHFYSRSLCGGGRLCRRVKLVYLLEYDPALLETVSRSNARDGRRSSQG